VEASRVMIEKHEPERRRRSVTTLYCGCTCCCCCCLHSLGSLVGAAVAPGLGTGSLMPMTYYFEEETGAQARGLEQPGLSAVTIFWWTLCLLVLVGAALGIASNQGVIAGIVLLLVLPLLQLASAFITLLVLACWRRVDRRYQLKQLAKITGGIVLGSIVGIAVMFGIALLFGAFR